MVVKHCCYGLCSSDNRYTDKLPPGTYFIPFAKPGVTKEDMDEWEQEDQVGVRVIIKIKETEVYNMKK